MPYICQLRTDIPEGTLQILDLRPNTSQRSFIYDPPPQSKYARRPDNDTVLLTGTGPILTTVEFSGIAAWMLDHIEDGGGAALTAAEANANAAAVLALLDAGAAMTLGAVNGAMPTGAIGGGASTGTLAELLEVMAGGVYTLPAGSQVETAANAFDTAQAGSLTHSRHTFTSGSFNISRNEGRIAGFIDPTFEYLGTAGAALVLYADDGSLL
jgi:hypothetical protein